VSLVADKILLAAFGAFHLIWFSFVESWGQCSFMVLHVFHVLSW